MVPPRSNTSVPPELMKVIPSVRRPIESFDEAGDTSPPPFTNTSPPEMSPPPLNRVDELFSIPLPKLAEFPLNVQLITVGLLPALDIPPPNKLEFSLKVQFVTVGLLSLEFLIPPPKKLTFPLNVQSLTIGLLLLLFDIPPPPPLSTAFPLYVQ